MSPWSFYFFLASLLAEIGELSEQSSPIVTPVPSDAIEAERTEVSSPGASRDRPDAGAGAGWFRAMQGNAGRCFAGV